MPVSTKEQYEQLMKFVADVDMEDEITLEFLEWQKDDCSNYQQIETLLLQGHTLPVIAIDGVLRLAGKVDPAKIIQMVNQKRYPDVGSQTLH